MKRILFVLCISLLMVGVIFASAKSTEDILDDGKFHQFSSGTTFRGCDHPPNGMTWQYYLDHKAHIASSC